MTITVRPSNGNQDHEMSLSWSSEHIFRGFKKTLLYITAEVATVNRVSSNVIKNVVTAKARTSLLPK